MFGLWIKALSSPTEENYTLILKENEPSGGMTAAWILIAAVASGVLQALALWLNGFSGLPTQDLPFDPAGLALIVAIVTPIATFFGFYIGAAFIYLGAKMFKGQGDYGQQTFLQAMGVAPLTILTALLSLIPFCGAALTILVSFFSVYLTILAVKVAHRLDWLQAIGAVFLPSILIGVLLCCCIFGIITLAAPGIGEVFQEIQATLQP